MLFDNAFFERWRPRVLAMLRIVSAYLFILHGTSRLAGVPHIEIFHGLQAFSLVGIIGTLELVAGALLLLGLFTRPNCARSFLPYGVFLSGGPQIRGHCAHSNARSR